MARQKTNRTEGIFLKVSPEVKAEITRRQKLKGFNLSAEFDFFFRRNFMVKEFLEEEKFELEEKLLLVNGSLERIYEQEHEEARLTLTALELDKLRKMITKFNTIDSQYQAFITICETKKDLTKKDFKFIRKKYIN